MKPTRDGSGVRREEPAFALALLLCLACLVLDSCEAGAGRGPAGIDGRHGLRDDLPHRDRQAVYDPGLAHQQWRIQ